MWIGLPGTARLAESLGRGNNYENKESDDPEANEVLEEGKRRGGEEWDSDEKDGGEEKTAFVDANAITDSGTGRIPTCSFSPSTRSIPGSSTPR